ncbi:MAG: GYF domain-containing protein [Hyphomicrobiaceae bacterium]
MSDSEHPIEWYLAREGQQFGPLNDVELKKFIELGHMRPNDLLWRHGFPDWRPASSVFPTGRPAAPASNPTAPARAGPIDGQRVAAQAKHDAEGTTGPAQTMAKPRSRGAEATGQPIAGSPRGQAAPSPQRRADGRPAEQRTARPAAARAHRRSYGTLVVFLLLLVVLAGAALALHQTGRLSALMANFGLSDVSDSGNSQSGAKPATTGTAANASPAARANSSQSVLLAVGSSAQEVDANFQKSALWRLLKTEFPDWYAEQIRETARLSSEQKDEKAIAKYLADAMVALRRKHIAEALSASPPRLRVLASTFLSNLGRLSAHSIDACYSFISQGETNPAVVELMRSSEHSANLQGQVVAVFEAIAEGRKAPRAQAPPRREDYDALAAQLAQRGWNPADLQLFSDPRALSRATPQKVCQMVQDWFAAQLAVKDEDVQLRLLVEALKPVVAG